MSLSLSLLTILRHKIPLHQEIALYKGQYISYQQFLSDVAHLGETLDKHRQQRWALYHEEAYPFAVALFALFSRQRHIVIPGNMTPATVATLKHHVDAFISDTPETTLAIETGTTLRNAIALPVIEPEQGQITIFTSGSTGQPKPIKKSLQQFEHEINALEECWGSIADDSEIISTVSHQHIYGLLFRVLWPLATGRLFHSERAMDSALAIKEAIDSKNGAVWVASPAHLKRLHENLPWLEAKAKLRLVFSSGGPLPAEAAQQLQAWHGQSATEVYGSSETGGIAWRIQYSATPHWQPLPGVMIKTDEDTRLAVKSAHIDPDNWYITDDSARIFADGSFTLHGRLDRIIKLEEKRLSLVELEQVLVDCATVKEAFCILLPPDKHLRESLAAVVVLNSYGEEKLAKEGKNALIKSIRQALGLHFELSLLPRKWRFVKQIPVNEQAKTDRHAIQGLFIHDE